MKNRQIHLVKRPQGVVTPDCFALVEADMPVPGEGQVLVQNLWLSLDPYMRGRMDEAKSYAAVQPLNAVMTGGTAGVVAESNNPKYAKGDLVVGALGWQEYGVSDGSGQYGAPLRKVTDRIPLSAYLGCVGMPGVTAWHGVNKIIEPKAGETLVVTAASGAVGSVVGQLAKAKGVRVVGIAGGAAKCAYVRDELGFDACIDYKAGEIGAALAEAAPKGIDGVFENVGGPIFDAILPRMNAFGRVALCGTISGYNGAPSALTNLRSILTNRLRVQGFIVSDHLNEWPEALAELIGLVADGRLKYRESVAQGIASAPQAFIGLLKGENFGKQLVKLA
ncbi:MAG: zinc-containing alcohol dehydrogenase superfamily protein [Betaproteobacteria bacterium]|nr:zinc-containing alcohol dehydrogenase superfamily protein [Betaproteobacteria bacterium]